MKVLAPVQLGGERSVVFLHNYYYHFFYLAAALRRRGWDAWSVSFDSPESPHQRFYHGEDVNLFDPDPEIFQANIDAFRRTVMDTYRMVHFSGDGYMALSPAEVDGVQRDRIPWDFLELRRRGIKMGYSVSGCNDGIAQSSIRRWSGMCGKCPWEAQPDTCSDRRNLAWGHKVQMFCDVICTETQPALDHEQGPKAFREPLTTVLDAQLWRPDLDIPDEFRIPRQDGEILIFHGVGNYDLRMRGARNVKGTTAVFDAVERLQAEGHRVRLIFVTDVPSRHVRFIQAQADIIVDQLNYGRYGATAREAMMLGKPAICYINLHEDDPANCLESLAECPLVSATEGTILPVLRALIQMPEQRHELGRLGRAYALKWHGAEAAAERYERMYDRLVGGLTPAEVTPGTASAATG